MSIRLDASLVDRAKEATQFETGSDDRDKDKLRKAFGRCLWSWSLPI